MILSDRDIRTFIQSGKIKVDPYHPGMVQPSSLDLCLGYDFMAIDGDIQCFISPQTKVEYKQWTVDKGITIKPKSFVLGITKEMVKIPNDIAAFIQGRSSYGRIGLSVVSAGFIDAGYSGKITLQFYNHLDIPIYLHCGSPICQIVFLQMSSEAEKGYQGKYGNTDIIVGSKLFHEFNTLKSLKEL